MKTEVKAIIMLAIFMVASFSIYMYVFAVSSTLQGWVTNIEGTQYLPGVNVSLWNTTNDFIASNLTDANGMFYFGQLNDTTYYVNLTGSSQIPRINASIALAAGANTQNFTMYTQYKGSYNVTVVDWTNGRPIPNANVNITWATSSHSRATSSNGWVILEVPANYSGSSGVMHDFIVSANGYATNVSVTQRSIMEGTNTNITIALEGTCRLYGYVVDSNRNGPNNITGALIQLRNDDNSSLLNWSNTYYYNITTDANGYYSIRFPDDGSLTNNCESYMYTSATGYYDRGDFLAIGGSQNNISMVGAALLSGTVVDDGNKNYAISGATVRFYNLGSVVYQATTDSNGQFSISAKRGENRTLLNIIKTGYSTYSNSTVLNDTVSYGQINMTGTGTFSGTVVDHQNSTIKVSGATVTFTPVSGGASYTNTTDSAGLFTATLSSATNYDISVSASGYYYNGTFSNRAAIGSLGAISLTGLNHITGTITDSSNLIDTTPDSVQVIVNSSSSPNSYLVYGNSNGQYSVYIPNTMTSYSLYFIKSGYNTSSVTSGNVGSPTISVALKGATRVQGTARDAYNNNVLGGVLVEFYNPSNNQVYYQTTTDGNGYYGTDIGVNFNFGVKASKSGYNNYINGTNHAWGIMHTENLNMNGSTSIRMVVTDSVSGSPVPNTQVCAYYTSPSSCDYPMTTDSSGIASFSIMSGQYKLQVSKSGYITQTLPALGYYSSDFSQTVILSAHANVYVYDQNAVNQVPVPYASVVAYSFYNNTIYNYTLSETIANITAACNGSARPGINITLTGIDVAYNQSNLTVSGETNITFYRVPSGRANLTVDGSSVGCQFYDTVITIGSGGQAYQFGTYDLAPTYLTLWVVDPVNSSVQNADVELVGSAHINCTTNSSGQCTMAYVTGYSQNLSANTSTLYYRTNKSYWVTPGAVNDFTGNPLVMDPMPGNLSVFVNGSVIQGANVTISNSTYLNHTLTNANGWANFTNLTSVFNVTVNGTDRGYSWSLVEGVYVKPLNVTAVIVTLTETTLLVTVTNGSAFVNGSNVTLWNLTSGSVALNGSGNPLYGITDANGQVYFRQVVAGSYNMTVNTTGFNFYDKVVSVGYGSNSETVVLNDIQPPWYQNAGINPSSPAENQVVTIWAEWLDNAALSLGILEINEPGVGIYNYSQTSTMGGKGPYNSTFVLQGSWTGPRVGKTIQYRIYGRDLAGFVNSTGWLSFSIRDVTPPSVSITTTPTNPLGDEPVSFVATASDNLNVTSIEVWVNYVLRRVCTNSTPNTGVTSCSWTGGPFTPDTYQHYFANASDAAGNTARDPAQNESLALKSSSLSPAISWPAATYDSRTKATFVFGGRSTSTPQNAIKWYNAKGDSLSSGITVTGFAPGARGSVMMSTGGENLTIIGGFNDTDFLDQVVMFNTSSNTSAIMARLPAPGNGRTGASAVNVGSLIYIFGGWNGTHYLDDILVYDTTSPTSVPAAPSAGPTTLPYPVYAASAVYSPANGRVYIFGGWNGTNISTIIQYVPQTSVAALSTKLPSGRYGASGAFWWGNNNIYLFGGAENTSASGPIIYMSSILEFNPATNSVRTMHTSFPSARSFTAAATDNVTGKIIIFGGQTNTGPLQDIYSYLPIEANSVWIDPAVPNGDLSVSVRDMGGNPLASVAVEVRNSSGLVSSSTTSGSGSASLTGLPVENYTLVTNGSGQGYGINTTAAEVLAGSNSMIVILPTTTLNVNITDANLVAVPNANVTLYSDTAGTAIALDGAGNPVYGYTNSAGMVTFSRVLPCTNCNITVSKQTYTPSWNTTSVTIAAGSNQTVHLDPQPGFFTDTYTLNFTINSLDPNADGINITVRYNDTGAVIGSNLTTDGYAVIYNVPNDYLDFIINGSVAGFSDTVSLGVPLGKIIINNGTTDLNGGATVSVVGTGAYYIRVIAGGYVTYDDLSNGTTRSGSYDSGIGGINGTISVPINGTTTLSGYVNDNNFRPNPPGGLGYEPVGYATVSVYTTDCNNIQGNLLRYQTVTLLSSNYSMMISPKQRLSPGSNQTFCIQITSDAYQQANSGTMSDLGSTVTKNIGMAPNESSSGWVKDFLTNTAITGATVEMLSAFCYPGTNTNCSAYQTTTDSSGYFSMAAAPRTASYSFLPFTMRITKVSYNQSTSTVSVLPHTGTYFLLPAGSAFIQVNVTGSDNLTSSVRITLDGNAINSTASGCAQIGNLLRCQINDGAHTLVVNGSTIGYEANTTSFTVLTGQVRYFDFHLNTTRVNITLRTDSGAAIPNVNVTLVGTSFSNQTDSGGAVLFSKMPTGTYNVTFNGGNIGSIYFYNSSSSTTFTVTDVMAGALSYVSYVLNDTAAYFNITNSSALPIPDINFTANNTRTGQLYPRTLNGTGEVKFANAPYGNYSIQFIENEVYMKGYIPQNFTAEILPGEDWNTNNSFAFSLNDVMLSFNLSNSTSDPIISIPVNITLNGTQAASALGVDLNGTTDSAGEILMHEAVPTAYAGTYLYSIYANASGYGIWTGMPLTISLTGTNISKVLSPLSITVRVRDLSGSTLSSPGVNVSLMIGGNVAQNITGSFLNATGVTDSVTFTHLYVENYTINITSVSYFSQNTSVDLGAAASEITESNFTMVARTLTVNIFDPNGNPITQNVETKVYNTTHDIATNTTGDNLYENTTTGSLMFYGLRDGMFNVSVESENYTKVQNWTFDTSAGTYEHNFTMTPRVFTVYINDTNGGAITELVEVRIYNSTDIETNITGDLMYHNTTTGATIFNCIRDGIFNVSVVSENYTAQNWTLDTSLGPYVYTFHLIRTGIGYFNITIRDNDTLAAISGATVTLYNLTDTVTSGTTGSDGRLTLQTNVSVYNESLYVNASYTGYDANLTGPYNITAGEIKNIVLTISQTPVSPPPYTPPPPPSGGGGGSTFTSGGGGASCTESWTCSAWGSCIGGEQTRTCTDSSACGTVWNRPVLEQSCTVSMSISVTEAYLNAGDCVSSTLSISNTGSTSIENIEIEPFTITDCCSVTPAQTSISSIAAGQSRTVLLQVCAGMYTEKGDYSGTVEASAGSLTRSATLYAHVTRNYAEVLQDRISALEAEMDAINLGTLDSVQMGLLNLAREQLDMARTYLSARNYEGATRALDAAEDYLSQLKAHVPQEMDLSWLMVLALPLAIVLLIGFAGWHFLVRKRTRTYKYKPPRYYPTATMPPKVDKGFLLKELKSLESKVLGIRKERLAETDRYYYEKARRALENMEHHIMQDNIASAKVLLNEAETSLRVLESRLLSFDIIKKHEGSK